MILNNSSAHYEVEFCRIGAEKFKLKNNQLFKAIADSGGHSFVVLYETKTLFNLVSPNGLWHIFHREHWYGSLREHREKYYGKKR